VSDVYLIEIIIGETRCQWLPTGHRGTIVRLWQDYHHGGDLAIDIVWDDKPNNEQAYFKFDKELAMLDENDEIIDWEKENAHETSDSNS